MAVTALRAAREAQAGQEIEGRTQSKASSTVTAEAGTAPQEVKVVKA
jgi:hypothetical protein